MTYFSPGSFHIQCWPTAIYTTLMLFRGVELQVLACFASDPVKDEYNLCSPLQNGNDNSKSILWSSSQYCLWGILRYWGEKKIVVSLRVILQSFIRILGGSTTIGCHSLPLSLRWQQWLECLSTAPEKLQRPRYNFQCYANPPFVLYC